MEKIGFRDFYNNILLEMPLPATWDNALFDERIPFSKRIKYAQEKALKVGAGSSRIAFKIPYEGRPTILKVAKNKKGMAQNEEEAQKLSDWYLKGLEITIPMIDYDEENNQPTWIHTEFATKAKDSDFVKACGGNLRDLMTYVVKYTGRDRNAWFGGDASKVREDSELASSLAEFAGNYDVPLGDFGRLANWGIFNGQPVIIDVGLSNDIQKQYYS